MLTAEWCCVPRSQPSAVDSLQHEFQLMGKVTANLAAGLHHPLFITTKSSRLQANSSENIPNSLGGDDLCIFHRNWPTVLSLASQEATWPLVGSERMARDPELPFFMQAEESTPSTPTMPTMATFQSKRRCKLETRLRPSSFLWPKTESTCSCRPSCSLKK